MLHSKKCRFYTLDATVAVSAEIGVNTLLAKTQKT